MASNKKNKIVNNIDDTIKSIKNNKSVFYFFVFDCKNTPNAEMAYVYNIAKELKDKGHKVTMLYQLEDEYTEGELYQLRKKNATIDYNRVFEGVGEWLGNEYSSLPHMNISTEELSVSASDFLFIPEVLSSLMFETYKHKLPCKRYVILYDFKHVTDFIPLGVEWKNYGIYDVIATTQKQGELIKNVFPYVNVTVLPPLVSDAFRKPLKPKNLVVNLIVKDQKDINRIIKPFYWKYPMYKFISFKDLRNFPQHKFAELLQEGIITIWVDEKTPFGNSAIEAMRCENIVIGKIPEEIPEWMMDDEGLLNNGLWVYNLNDIPDVLSKAIGSWMSNEVPEELTNEMSKMKDLYTSADWSKNIESLYQMITEEQCNTLSEVRDNIINNKDKQ